MTAILGIPGFLISLLLLISFRGKFSSLTGLQKVGLIIFELTSMMFLLTGIGLSFISNPIKNLALTSLLSLISVLSVFLFLGCSVILLISFRKLFRELNNAQKLGIISSELVGGACILLVILVILTVGSM